MLFPEFWYKTGGFPGKDVSLEEERTRGSSKKYFLKVYCVPGTIPGTAMHQTRKVPFLMLLRFYSSS
jgi:hypothetical protein